MDLDRVIAVANGKGGVGKSSLTANLAGEFAYKDLRVLIVDLDVQGNQTNRFGLDAEATDSGESIYNALVTGSELAAINGVRPNIDLIAGGSKLAWVQGIQYGQVAVAGPQRTEPWARALQAWRQALGEQITRGDYDMVLLDCPPGNRDLQTVALSAARWILAPIDAGVDSWTGLWDTLGPIVTTVQEEINPDLAWLGMVLFAHPVNATRGRKQVQEYLGDNDAVPLFDSSIRAARAAAIEAGNEGLLMRELNSQRSKRSVLEALRALKKDSSVKVPAAPSKAAMSLAEDYELVANEVADRILAAEGNQS